MPHARIMIAALHGRSGKTVITLGVLRALKQQGLVVQPFKKGPDFIDPGWHSIACKRASRNLDRFFMTPRQIQDVLVKSAQTSDLSIIESAMGIYDGTDLAGSSSSAEIAKLSKTPVVLVVDTTRMTRTSAALVLGCQQFDPEVQIAGVILNRVRGQRHEKLMREAIESYCGIPVLGAVPVDPRLTIPDRHLGLISSTEVLAADQSLDAMAEVIAEHIDLEALVALAKSAEPLLLGEDEVGVGAGVPCSDLACNEVDVSTGVLCTSLSSDGVDVETTVPCSSLACDEEMPLRIAVVRDSSFCFYYEENLQALQELGAELVFINSLKDHALPDNVHALYIGGGFPEEFASQLEANKSFRSSVKAAIEANLPIYAECGGLMYLGRSLNYQGHSYEMVGALPLDTALQEQRQAHGYSQLEANNALPWLQAGSILKGHEFHHSRVEDLDPSLPLAFNVKRGKGIDGMRDGVSYKGVLAVYTHVNAFASPLWAASFVKQARSYQKL